MRSVVKMDEKGRVQIPKRIRKVLKLKSRQLISIEVKKNFAYLKKMDKLIESRDKVLYDILINPGHSKIRITKVLLDKMKEEAWTP